MMPIPGAKPVSPGREEETEQTAAPPTRPTQAPRLPSRPTRPPEPSTPSGIAGARPVSPPSPSMRERLEAGAAGASRGIAESLPAMGAFAGGAILAPAGPVGSGLGVALGGAIGEQGRRLLSDRGMVPQTDELPDELRPFSIAGEVLGSGASLAGAPFAAAGMGMRAGSGRVGNFLNKIIETTTRAPRATAFTEAASLGSAAGAEGLFESVAPDRPLSRMGTGAVAGAVNPAALVSRGATAAADAIPRVAQRFSEGARQTRAGQLAVQIVREAGEDPAALAQSLRQLDLPGANRTAAQLTGSPALQALEANLTRSSAQFGQEAQRQAEDSLAIMRNTIGLLEETGDPAALREAAQVRRQYFDQLIQGRFQAAERAAVEAAEGISPDDPQAMSQLSQRVRSIVGDALSDARTAERELYSEIPDGPAQGTSIMQRAQSIKEEELLPEEELPGLVGQRLQHLMNNEGETSIKELRIFRSRMLDKAREASAKGDFSDARIYGQMAEAALDDLSALEVPGLNEARMFSNELNDRFTRTFAGEALAKSRTGAQRIPPEVLMRRALGSGNELAALRLSQLERAVRFGTPEAADELMDIQSRVLRSAASNAVDPQSGELNLRQLARFRRNNAEILDELPEVKAILSDASRARELLDATAARGQQATKAIDQQAAFARVARSENPVRAVGEVLRGRQPQREFTQLARLARREGDTAVAGLRRSVLDDAFAQAGGDTERFSFDRYQRLLFEPSRPGQPSPMELMRRNQVIDTGTSQRLETLLREARKVEDTIKAKPVLEDMLGQENALFDMLIRIAGAGTGSRIMQATGSGGPGSIVAAGAGSKFAQKVFERIPAGQIQHVMMEAARNPRFMATLLETPTSEREAIQLGRRANAFLWQAGLRGAEELVESSEASEEGTAPPESAAPPLGARRGPTPPADTNPQRGTLSP